MTNYRQVQQKKKSAHRGLLPVIGITLAVLLAVVAYFLAPALIDFGSSQNARLGNRFDEFDRSYGEGTFRYVVAALLWLVLLAVSSLIVAMFVGKDPQKDALNAVGPPPLAKNKKLTPKQLRAMRKAQKRAARQRR